MLPGPTVGDLPAQLLRIARDPTFRESVYEQIGDYCHQCRNRLNSLKLSLFLAMRRPGEQSSGISPSAELWAEIARDYDDLERRVEQVQTLCRPMSLNRVSLPIDLLMKDRRAAWTELMQVNGKVLNFDPPVEPARAGFDVDRLGQALDEWVDWRAGDTVASKSSTIRWWVSEGLAHLVWEEQGGNDLVAEHLAADVGRTSWSLPLLARVVIEHGGDFQIRDDRELRVALTWPTVSNTPRVS